MQPERRGEAVLGRIERQAEERRARNSGNAVRPAGEILPIEQDQPDDFAEAERDDGEIVAAQPQHRKAEQDAGKGGEDAGKRQAYPERQSEIVRKQRVGIGADRVEGDIAEIEQPGETDHDIQPEAKHRVGDDEDGEVEQITVAVENDRNDERDDEESRRGVGDKRPPRQL